MKIVVTLFVMLAFTAGSAQNSRDNKPRPQSIPSTDSIRKQSARIPRYIYLGRTRYGRTHLINLDRRPDRLPDDGTNIALLTGLWIPTGDITPLGLHPELGFQLGAKRKRHSIDFTVAFKFLKTSNYYYATRIQNTSRELTNHFFGGYIGVDYRREILRTGKHEISLLAGVGVDGFDVFPYDTYQHVGYKSILTYNVNTGIGYRLYYKHKSYLGLNLNYNFVDYTKGNVIDFTGNPVTMRLIVGGIF